MPPSRRRATTSPAALAANDDARAAALATFIAGSEKGSVFTFDGRSIQWPCVSTGAMSLDYALGIGGLPRGRITEIYGPESVGKTSLALSVAAQSIRGGGMAAIIDVEHAINPDHIRGMGVDDAYFAVSQPDSAEDAFTKLEQFLESDLFDVIIIDSVAMLVPKTELEGEMTDQQVGLQARVIGKGIRKVQAAIGRSKAVVIFINQLRMKVGVQFGNPEDTPGGKSLKYAAAVRLDVRAAAGDRIKSKEDAKQFVGLGTNVRVVKNKMAPPQKKAEYKLYWGKGIDFASSVFDVAKELGVLVPESGNSYRVAATGSILEEDGVVVRGAPKIQDLMERNAALTSELAAACYAAMKDRGESSGASGPIPDSDFLTPEEQAGLESEIQDAVA